MIHHTKGKFSIHNINKGTWSVVDPTETVIKIYGTFDDAIVVFNVVLKKYQSVNQSVNQSKYQSDDLWAV